MLSTASEVMVFYVRLFTVFGIQLRPKAETEKKLGWRIYRLISSVFYFLEIGLFFVVGLSLLVHMGYVGIKKDNIINVDYFLHMIMANFLLSMIAHIYFQSVTNRIDIADTIEFIKMNSKKCSSELNNNVRKCLVFNIIICSLPVIVYVGVLVYANCDPTFYHNFHYFFFAIFPYALTLGFFQSHCVLFFSVLMELLTDSLAPRTPNTALLSAEFMENYERVRKLAGKVNFIFSPVLALTCVINLFSIALLLAFPYPRFYKIMAEFNPAAIFNFISCLLCLNSVIKCNRKRLELVRKISNHQYEVKKLPLKLMRRSLDFHSWLINVMLTDDDFFNVGRVVPMDVTVFLMIFQTIFDMYGSLQLKYSFILIVDALQFRNLEEHSN